MWRLFSQENFLNSTETKNQFREIFVKSSSHCCDFNKRRYDDKPGNEGNNFGSGEFSSQLITKQLVSNTTYGTKNTFVGTSFQLCVN